MIKKITLLIGIPGSGKSYFLSQFKTDCNNLILDDASQLENTKLILRDALNSKEIKNIYIADVNFLNINALINAEDFIKNNTKIYELYYIIFKTSKKIALNNVKLRNDGRNVNNTINIYYNNYDEIIQYLQNKNLKIINVKDYLID